MTCSVTTQENEAGKVDRYAKSVSGRVPRYRIVLFSGAMAGDSISEKD